MPKKITLELTEAEAAAVLSAVIRAKEIERSPHEGRALGRVIDKFCPMPAKSAIASPHIGG